MPAKKDKKAKAAKVEEPEESEEDAGSESEVEESPPVAKAKNRFAAALDDSDEEDESEEEEVKEKKKPVKKKAKEPEGDEDVSAMFGKKKKRPKDEKVEGEEKAEEKGKDKKKKDDKKEGEKAPPEKEKKKKKEKKPAPMVCEVVEVQPVPKKEKLRLCKVRTTEGSDLVDIVTSAVNIVAGKRFLVALPGVTTANGTEVKLAKVGGVESSGMFCGPLEMGWATDVLEANHAVMLDDTVELGSPAPSYDDALQMHQDRIKAEKEKAEAEAAAAAAGAKGKKGKKGAKKEDDDLDALLADIENKDIKATPAPGKKGKKGKQDKKQEDDDFDAVLNEFKEPPKEEPKAPPKEEPAKAAAAAPKAAAPKVEEPAEEQQEEAPDAKTLANRKKKDKKKAAKAADDDDFDAALNEFKEEAAPALEPLAKEAVAPEEAAGGQEDAGGEDAAGCAETLDAKTLANRRKKEKKKAAKQGAGGGEGLWATGGDAKEDGKDAEEEAPAEAAASSNSAAPKAKAKAEAKAEPKKGAKKESAIVKAARERMEMERKLEEERQAFEAEQRRLIAEEEARIKEQEEKEQAEREKKRQAKLAKIQRQKDDGTYQTKKQKEFAKRAAMLREQFGFGKDDDKDDAEEGSGDEKEAPAAPVKVSKKDMIKKKKKPVKQAEDESTTEATAEEKPSAEEQPAPAKAKAEEAAASPEPDDDDDDWEKHAEEKEDEDGAEGKEAKDSDSDSGSKSDSDDDSKSSSSSSSSSSDMGYRSPIIVIMGHVDTGKTKLLDKIRRTNVQEGEAGGITQQIGATFFPSISLVEQTTKVDPDFDIEVPGIMIIDTPGHESFNNLRARGSSLCDMAILVIDIMHGLEPQTVESLEMLKKRRCSFIIALNKVDVCYQWHSEGYTGIRSALDRQEQFVRDEFEKRLGNIKLQLNERGLNVALYWENEDPRSTVSIVPTSALTGEGVPDLLYNVLYLTQTLMSSNLEVEEDLKCTVIEVKNIEGLGTTIDVILVNGTLHEGDQIVLAGMNGPIVTTIRALLTPKPMKEMRVKGEYVHHAKISMSMGIKICAPGLDEAIAGTELVVVGPDDDLEEIQEEVMEGFDSICDKQPEGVYVKASTLGSLEALLSFLKEKNIPVFDVGIGEVHKKDVKKASIMKEKKKTEYAVILAFDVIVNKEAKTQADHDGVQIMTADIIYHLFDKFTAYMKKVEETRKTETRAEAVFPVILQIDKGLIFNKKDPFIFGCTVVGGQLRHGTPICVPEKDNLCIGHVAGIEKEKKGVEVARRNERVCVKIEQNTSQTHITYGRHFDHSNQLFSAITRQSIDTLKEHFKDEMQKPDWELIMAMKKVFQIQ